ncbi:MAG: GIY-YIG nuclease family protein [Proteobacteria bacterium]|nr:GIY-YIG nuclease family protein [Pseudomonadota bacterium]MBU1716932.1 GIY-YIG nuclease family protein [Pseudomonadota bacterium]
MPTATLKIFLAFGDPKRLRTAELSNWTGKAVSGPRSEFEKVLEREESICPGVYFLTGTDPETNESAIYIGEAECLRDRVKSHLSKDFWNNITFFITKDENLTKAHIKYIEGRLIDVARITERSIVMNSQGSGAKLPESDREDMEIFLEKMLQVLPVLGVEAFVQTTPVKEETQQELLACNIKSLKASGYLTPNGIIVLKGSQAVLEARASSQKWPSVLAQRNKLIEEGSLREQNGSYVFTKNVEFSSPSSAAATIHGGSANGLTAWTNSNGQTLKQAQNV